jgi:protein-disulfide isomerase
MQKIARIVGLIALIVVIFAAIFTSINTKPSNSEIVWDTRTTLGNPDAKNYFIVYSDLVCPYCLAFENAILENEEEFKQYIEDNDILFEIRVSDFLYEYGEANPINSRYSAIATYCARDEGKFWDYYNKAITTVWNGYFKGEGKSGFAALIKNDQDYWTKIGEGLGLSDDFKTCIEEQRPLDEIVKNAAKTSELVEGLPAFKLNSYSPPGFSLSGTWEDVKAYFEEGLNS